MKRVLPVKPLLQHLEKCYEDDAGIRGKAIGVSRNRFTRLKSIQEIGWVTADRYAVRLGLHPVLIWEDWYLLTDQSSKHFERQGSK